MDFKLISLIQHFGKDHQIAASAIACHSCRYLFSQE